MIKFDPSSLTVMNDERLEINRVKFKGSEEDREDEDRDDEDAMDQLLVRALALIPCGKAEKYLFFSYYIMYYISIFIHKDMTNLYLSQCFSLCRLCGGFD
ncbi:hypothetical protein CsSME_00054232 [Camellia sinensis var. sinensis]